MSVAVNDDSFFSLYLRCVDSFNGVCVESTGERAAEVGIERDRLCVRILVVVAEDTGFSAVSSTVAVGVDNADGAILSACNSDSANTSGAVGDDVQNDIAFVINSRGTNGVAFGYDDNIFILGIVLVVGDKHIAAFVHDCIVAVASFNGSSAARRAANNVVSIRAGVYVVFFACSSVDSIFTSAAVQAVVAFAAVNPIVAFAAVNIIVASTTINSITASAAVQAVVAFAAVNGIVAFAAVDVIVAIVAHKRIGAFSAVDIISSAITYDSISTSVAINRLSFVVRAACNVVSLRIAVNDDIGFDERGVYC